MNPQPSYVQPQTQRAQLELPTVNRPESNFAHELGAEIGPAEQLFQYDNPVVEIIDEKFSGQSDRFKLARGGLKFQPLSPVRAKTWFEQYVQTGVFQIDSVTGTRVFKAKTMSEAVARSMLESPQFLSHIPRIYRILDVPIPIRTNAGDILTPKPGFNPALGIYCNPKVPPLKSMPIEEAKNLLERALAGFCWKNTQSKVHALARLITPYLRGLIGFNQRIPCWFFNGNRPRCGKDYLNGVAQIVYLGNHFEDQPLGKDSHETAKRIVAALRAGRRMMHFANCQYPLNDPAFIQAITGSTINARSLGATDANSDLELPNEIDYSLSANVGLTYREDVEPRCRKIELAYYDDNPNSRVFHNAKLHFWVLDSRFLILEAIKSLVDYWLKSGCLPGLTPFVSYPYWAEVAGGVMRVAQLGDPCLPHQDDDLLGGDIREKAMRVLFQFCYTAFPNQWITKSDIYSVLGQYQQNDDRLLWFGDPSLTHHTGSRLGKALSMFDKRAFNGIRLAIDTSQANTSRWQYYFEKIP